MTDGCTPSGVITPPAVDASANCQVCAPGVAVAVAVAPEPYVMITVCPARRVIPVTVIRWPEQETTPRFDVVWPAPAAVVGGVHPAGMSTCSVPLLVPPFGALHLIVCVSPDCEAETVVKPRRMAAPLPPSTPYTVIDGDAPIVVSVPRLDERCCTVQVAAPVVDVAVAPGPPPPVSPYFRTSVCAEP